MNHWSTSPIGQTNEVARQATPKDDISPSDCIQSTKDVKQKFFGEDLQKIRRSNHSSHQQHRQDAMDDDEHDGIIKGLLYPGLEDSAVDCDFFDEDYEVAIDAVRSSSVAATTGNSDATDNHALHRRSFDAFGDLEEEEDSYLASYYASMGRPYSDLSHQKLRR